MASYLAKGLLIKTHLINENDVVGIFLSEEHGRFEAIAKGAKKITSKFGGFMQSPFLLSLQLYKGKSQLQVISQIQSINPYKYIKFNANRFLLASVILESTKYATIDLGGTTEVFNLAVNVLNYLDNLENTTTFVIGAFALRLLSLEGTAPLYNECARCFKKVELSHYDYQSGGFLCKSCGQSKIAVDSATIEIMSLALSGRTKRAIERANQAGESASQCAERLSLDSLEHYLNKRIKSRNLLGI